MSDFTRQKITVVGDSTQHTSSNMPRGNISVTNDKIINRITTAQDLAQQVIPVLDKLETLEGLIDVNNFGADYTGVLDSSEAFLQAANTAQGKAILVRGLYTIARPVTLPKNSTFIITGKVNGLPNLINATYFIISNGSFVTNASTIDGIGGYWYFGEGSPVIADISASSKDMYLDTSSGNLYQYDGENWNLVASIKGQQGDTGSTGQRGSEWTFGTDTPIVSSDDLLGDMYLNVTTYDVYSFNGTAWVHIGNLQGPQGEQGPDGAKGDTGERGNIWTVGKGVPATITDNISGDLFLDSDTSNIYVFNGTTWVLSANIKGLTGDVGPVGQRGSIWTSGNGVPTDTTGFADDLYLNTANGEVYQFNGSAWTKIGNITGPVGEEGPQGDQGPIGDTGVRGSLWTTGTGAPTSTDNNVNDLYLDNGGTGNVYQFTASGWTLLCSLLGPEGKQGDKGDTGEQGPDGEKGDTGATGQRGTIWWTGTAAPTTTVPASPLLSDMYLDTSNGNLYSYQSTGWVFSENIIGPQGPTGDTGDSGSGLNNLGDWVSGTTYDKNDYVFYATSATDSVTAMYIFKGADSYVSTIVPYSDLDNWVQFTAPSGERGTIWTIGTTDPTSSNPSSPLANDLYLNTTSDDIFQYTNSAWSNVGNIKGSVGATGIRGTIWTIGTVAPTTTSPASPNSGDMYLNSTTYDIYSYNGTEWTLTGNIMGKTGAEGIRGTLWTTGTVAPTASTPASPLANDLYLNTTTNDVYQYENEQWTIIANIKGSTGNTGETGTRGTLWTTGTGVPTSTSPANPLSGDFYLDSTTYDVYQYSGTAWAIIVNIKGATGDTGAAGEKGDSGDTGQRGSQWTYGSGAPTATTDVLSGDMYLDTDADNVYSYSGTAWVNVTNIKGATGDAGKTGDTGADGVRGSLWTVGTGAPTATTDINADDMYLDTDAGNIYQYSGTAWAIVGNIYSNLNKSIIPVGPTSTSDTNTSLELDYYVKGIKSASLTVQPGGTASTIGSTAILPGIVTYNSYEVVYSSLAVNFTIKEVAFTPLNPVYETTGFGFGFSNQTSVGLAQTTINLKTNATANTTTNELTEAASYIAVSVNPLYIDLSTDKAITDTRINFGDYDSTYAAFYPTGGIDRSLNFITSMNEGIVDFSIVASGGSSTNYNGTLTLQGSKLDLSNVTTAISKTPTAGDNSTQLATTAFVTEALSEFNPNILEGPIITMGNTTTASSLTLDFYTSGLGTSETTDTTPDAQMVISEGTAGETNTAVTTLSSGTLAIASNVFTVESSTVNFGVINSGTATPKNLYLYSSGNNIADVTIAVSGGSTTVNNGQISISGGKFIVSANDTISVTGDNELYFGATGVSFTLTPTGIDFTKCLTATAPTPDTGDNSSKIATTAFVADSISSSTNTDSTYTVAELPTTANIGERAFATNGRKPSEGSGAGSGVPVFYDGTAWFSYCSGAIVEA